MLAGLFISACDRSDVAAPPPGPRIVSTVPAATLNLVQIGAVDSLVGVSKFDTLFLPESKQNLPIVGDYENLNYERLMSLRPSVLVIQTSEPRMPARLKDLASKRRFEIVNIRLEAVGDLWNVVQTLGCISGREAGADAAIARAQRELVEIVEQYKDQPKPRVVYIVFSESLMIVGGETILDEMITMAGGENVGAQVGNGWPVINMEALVKLNPDVLLIGKPDEPPQRSNDPRLATWQRMNIPAVRNKRVFLVTDGGIHVASLQLPQQVRMLADMIHKKAPSSDPASRGEQ